MNCTNCGSMIRIGGPRCCDGGKAKREAAARRAEEFTRLKERVATLENRIERGAMQPVCTATETLLGIGKACNVWGCEARRAIDLRVGGGNSEAVTPLCMKHAEEMAHALRNALARVEGTS